MRLAKELNPESEARQRAQAPQHAPAVCSERSRAKSQGTRRSARTRVLGLTDALSDKSSCYGVDAGHHSFAREGLHRNCARSRLRSGAAPVDHSEVFELPRTQELSLLREGAAPNDPVRSRRPPARRTALDAPPRKRE